MNRHALARISSILTLGGFLAVIGCSSGGGGGMGCGNPAAEKPPLDCPAGQFEDPKTHICKKMTSEQRKATQSDGNGSSHTQSTNSP